MILLNDGQKRPHCTVSVELYFEGASTDEHNHEFELDGSSYFLNSDNELTNEAITFLLLEDGRDEEFTDIIITKLHEAYPMKKVDALRHSSLSRFNVKDLCNMISTNIDNDNCQDGLDSFYDELVKRTSRAFDDWADFHLDPKYIFELISKARSKADNKNDFNTICLLARTDEFSHANEIMLDDCLNSILKTPDEIPILMDRLIELRDDKSYDTNYVITKVKSASLSSELASEQKEPIKVNLPSPRF